MGSQCSPVDFSRDLEEGKKALLLCCKGSNLGETRGGRWDLAWLAGQLGISAVENPADGWMEQGQEDRLPADGTGTSQGV